MVKVLFVCLGNICRSPMAEAILRDKAKNFDIIVDSCGISSYHQGEIPHLGTRKILDIKNISYDGMYSRRITREDFDNFDYIIGMDDSNMDDMRTINKTKKIYKLTDFASKTMESSVSDPFYYGNFEQVFDIINDGVEGLLKHILSENLNK